MQVTDSSALRWFMKDKSVIEWLKEYSAIAVGLAAILYVWGFLVYEIYYRLLGLEIVGDPIDYIKLAGDYITSLVISMIQLVDPSAVSQYSQKLVQVPLRYATLFLIIAILLLIAMRIFNKPWINTTFGIVVRVFAILIFLVLYFYEIDMFRVRNVLQPFDASEIEALQPLIERTKVIEERAVIVKEIYEDYAEFGVNRPGFNKWFVWFNPLSKDKAVQERASTYLALLLLNLGLFVIGIRALFFMPIKYFLRTAKITIGLMLMSQSFLFPLVYATLGRTFTFPVVSLKLKIENGESPKNLIDEAAKNHDEVSTHALYLITQNENEVVVYDRLSLCQIKYIPRSQIVEIIQLFKASPFEGCQNIQGDFNPCEALWKPRSNIVTNF